MTIIVEDGTGVVNANSYIDETYLNQFVSARGLTAPSSTELAEQYILKAMDYLGHFASRFIGNKSLVTNSLDWPRTDVVLNGFDFSEEGIPPELRLAQAQLVVEQVNGLSLYPEPVTSTSQGLVTQSTIGPLTEKYSEKGFGVASQYKPIHFPSVMVFLNKLLKDNRLSTVKV